jgi:hypothetical protein
LAGLRPEPLVEPEPEPFQTCPKIRPAPAPTSLEWRALVLRAARLCVSRLQTWHPCARHAGTDGGESSPPDGCTKDLTSRYISMYYRRHVNKKKSQVVCNWQAVASPPHTVKPASALPPARWQWHDLSSRVPDASSRKEVGQRRSIAVGVWRPN